MRGFYHLVLAAPLAAVALIHPIAINAAAPTSSADRARVALLVYQSQSARQADMRRGDALTRQLRLRADGALKLASVTRANLAKALAEGAKAKGRALALEEQLKKDEQSLADTAQRYSAELAKRDEEYARERTVLISTGERLLSTPEGRRVLDLYNAGGEANWKEAKAVLQEMRQTRRALDTRDTAIMYAQARAKGLETTASVIAIYEELIHDDPSQANDWFLLSILYRESGANAKALEAAEKAVRLAAGELAQTRALIEVARAHRGNGDVKNALITLERAETAARAAVAKKPDAVIRLNLLANVLTQRGSTLLDSGDWRSAREVYAEDIRLIESLLPRVNGWPVKEMYLSALLGLAHSYWEDEDIANATPQIRKAHAFAIEAARSQPNLTEAKEKAALTSGWVGDLYLSEWKFGPALKMYSQAADAFVALTTADPNLAWYDPNREYLNRVIGGAEFELNRGQSALDHLKLSEQISRKYSSNPYRVTLQAGLHRQGVVLAALGRKQDAERHWEEALRIGNLLLEQDSNGPGRWARIEQSNILLDMANEALGGENFVRGLQLVAQAEPLIQSVRRSLPIASQATSLTSARLKAELIFASGDAARSTEVYEEALRASEFIANDPAVRIELRFGRADLLLSSSKQRLALNDRSMGADRLRLAHEFFRKIGSECDCPEVHRKFAETSWLKAQNDLDQVSWTAVASLFQQLQDKKYLNENAEQLFKKAQASVNAEGARPQTR